MKKENTLITAEKQKGKIQVLREDGLVHFQWVSRENGALIDDLIVFPDEAQLKYVEKVKDGHVFYLDFQGSKQLFYWLQEFKDETAALEIVTKVNSVLVLIVVSKDPIPSTNTSKPISVDQVTQAIQSIPRGQVNKEPLTLQAILNSDRVVGVLTKHPELVEELAKFLPDGTKPTLESVTEHIRSPQFYKTVRVIDEALRSGQLYGFCQSLGLDPTLGLTGGVEAFILAFAKKNQGKEDKMDESK